jgi:hypothetical protein
VIPTASSASSAPGGLPGEHPSRSATRTQWGWSESRGCSAWRVGPVSDSDCRCRVRVSVGGAVSPTTGGRVIPGPGPLGLPLPSLLAWRRSRMPPPSAQVPSGDRLLAPAAARPGLLLCGGRAARVLRRRRRADCAGLGLRLGSCRPARRGHTRRVTCRGRPGGFHCSPQAVQLEVVGRRPVGPPARACRRSHGVRADAGPPDSDHPGQHGGPAWPPVAALPAT